MDKKAMEMLTGFHQKFLNNTFLEDDLYGFMPLIREYVPEKSALRELCHFVSHRERDRGETVTHLKKLIEFIDKEQKLPTDDISMWGLYPSAQITAELNAFFDSMGLEQLPQNTVNDMILCMMSIMQNIPLRRNDVYLGELSISLLKGRNGKLDTLGLYVAIDAKKGFTVFAPDGQSRPVYFQVPIIVMYPKTTLTTDGYSFQNKPMKIDRIEGKIVILFEQEDTQP